MKNRYVIKDKDSDQWFHSYQCKLANFSSSKQMAKSYKFKFFALYRSFLLGNCRVESQYEISQVDIAREELLSLMK